MDDRFQIWIDRLKGGNTQKIAETFDPTFLGIHEQELRFESPVVVNGEAYVSEGELILRLKASTRAFMPCSICNQMIQVEVNIENFYYTHPTEEVPGSIFDFSAPLRETILLELPRTIECKGNCPERTAIAPYMRAKQRAEKSTYFPFKDLNKE